MNAKYLKFIVVSFLTSLTVGCSSINISEVKSNVERPGLPSGSPVISYSWKLLAKKPIKIKSISLNKDNIETEITTFTIYDLKDGKIINSNTLPIGNYFIKFKIPGNKLDPEEENIIHFEYSGNAGSKKINFKSTKTADLLMK
jgi:hypothetical protein